MSRLRFKPGEIAIILPAAANAPESIRRWLGTGLECTILQIAAEGWLGQKYDYLVLVHDSTANGTRCATMDCRLRKKRKPPLPREEPQVTKLKRDIKRWLKLPAREKAKVLS